MSLKKKTVGGLKWTLLERVSVQGLTFVVKIVLARILFPEEFGIVATVGIILLIAKALIDSGMGSALVQHQGIERKDVSTVFVMNLVISVLILIGLTFAAPQIANFYEKPILKYVLPALALGFVISAFGQTQMKMLQKNLEFKKLFTITLPSTIISGITGITMALTGFGVWALVAQSLVSTTVSTSCIWKFCNPDWRPRLEFRFASLRKIAGFSLARLTVELTVRFSKALPSLIIAKAFGMQDLGFYNRAQTFQRQPVSSLTSSLNRVLFPVFSEIQNDDQKMRNALRQGIPLLAFIVIPSMFWLITVAEPLVLVLLTEKWSPSIPYLRLFPLIGITYTLAGVKLNVINGKGLSRLIVTTTFFKQAIHLTTLYFTWRHGILAILIGHVCCSYFCSFVNDFFIWRILKFPMSLQLYDWVPYLICGIASCAIASLLNLLQIQPGIVMLLFQTIVFTATYLMMCWLARLRGIDFLLARIRKLNSLQTSM